MKTQANNRGRPETISDKELKDIILEYVVRNPGIKVSYVGLENFAAGSGRKVGRQVFARRMHKIISEVNEPNVIEFDGVLSSPLPFPNVQDIVEKYWKNKVGLLNALISYNELIQKLYDKAVMYDRLEKENQELKYNLNKKSEEVKNIKLALERANQINRELAVQGTFASERQKKGLVNTIDIQIDKKRGTTFDWLEKNNLTEIVDKKNK